MKCLNMFATMAEFNNLIGDPVNRYRQDYKAMSKLRYLYFENIDNTPDLDKFISFYRWIDSSLSVFLQQLIPASADTSKSIRTLVESHVLERNKYWTKFPIVTGRDRTSGIQGVMEPGGASVSSPARMRDGLNPVLSGRPISALQSDHAPYWRLRADRRTAPLATGISAVDNDRQTILANLQSTYAREKNTPQTLTLDHKISIHGGINYSENKDRRLISEATRPFGTIAASGAPP